VWLLLARLGLLWEREDGKGIYARFFCVEVLADGKLVALWFWEEKLVICADLSIRSRGTPLHAHLARGEAATYM
jgi:hypothetical protein